MENKIVDIIKSNWFNKFPEENPSEGEMSNRGAKKAAEEIVKLFAIPDVIKSVCDHPFGSVDLISENPEIFKCQNCNEEF